MVSQISATDAFKLLDEQPKDIPNSVLIDVRTKEETDFVGFVDLSAINAKTILLPWKTYPHMTMDPGFTDKLTNILNQTFPSLKPEELNLFFLCRSGARSLEAAMFMSDLGYGCYNITDGFEGPLDENGQRGNLKGWKAQNLPWRQN